MALAAVVHRLCICILVAVNLGRVLGEVSAHTTNPGTQTFFPIQVDRVLVDKENNSESTSALTARTKRADPLDNLKKYKGGYNITNRHYWSSTIFTGTYGYSIAAMWLIGGLVYAGILLTTTICFNKKAKRGNNSPLYYKRERLWPILLGILFTFLAIVASGVVLGGSSRFHSRAKSIKNIILATAQEATGTIYNVTEAVLAMQVDTELYGYFEGSSRLNSTSHKLNDEAVSIQTKAENTACLVNKGLKILKVVTIVTVVLNLIVVLALLASASLRLRWAIRLLIIISWLLTTLFWIYFGFYFFLDKFAGDTCAALDEYRQDPQNSSLSSILPCNDQLSARSVLHDTGAGIHNLIDKMNANIPNLHSMFPDLDYVCNPISGPPDYNYQLENCSSNTIQIGDISQILKRYTCSGGDGGTCKEGEFILASDYSRVLVYTSSIQNILDAFPGMESLVNCQLVKDAFSEILFKQCKPLKKYVRMTWAALVVLSAIMVALVLTLTLESYHDRRSHSSDGSVKPQLTSLESDSTEMASNKKELKLEP